jgi:hypothetical protein
MVDGRHEHSLAKVDAVELAVLGLRVVVPEARLLAYHARRIAASVDLAITALADARAHYYIVIYDRRQIKHE